MNENDYLYFRNRAPTKYTASLSSDEESSDDISSSEESDEESSEYSG
jgi:hypothetical protein